MSEARKNEKTITDDHLVWQIWVSEPLNQEADVLVKWSKTSFFGGSPTSKSRNFDGREYTLFHMCSEEWSMKYALATALSNYRFIVLRKDGNPVSLEPYAKEIQRKSGGILGDAESMGRSGGMC